MTVYKYTGRTAKGALKKGTVQSTSEKLAIAKLKEQGINAREVHESTSFLHKDIAISKPVKQQEFVIYCRQFATLIRAGITILEATTILANQTSSKTFQNTLLMVRDEIKEGNAFSDSVANYPKVFPAIFTNMIRAGEATGNLDETLERLAAYFEKQYTLKKKIQSTMAYPVVLFLLTVAVVVFMMTTIVPRFEDMFAQFDAELPVITQMVLSVSDFIGAFWWLLLLLAVVVIGGANILYKQNAGFRYSFSVFLLKLPIFGTLLQKALIARMTRTLSSLFSSSVPILQALAIVDRVMNHEVIGRVIREARSSLKKGDTLSAPLENSWLFPPLVTQMTAIGEQTGSLDYMLANIASFYEAEVDRTVDTLKSLLEPLMIVFLSIVVGIIVIAIMVPMLSIYNQF